MKATMDHDWPQIAVEARCRVCGRRLTDPESVKAEIGPVCKEKQKRLLDEFIEESTCPKCGKVNPYPDAKHCPHCGAPMKTRTLKVVPT